MKINEVIIRPVLTEKATNLTKRKVYMFEVGKNTDKHKVKTTLEHLYKISISEVRIMIRKGKERKTGRRRTAKKSADMKIAYVVVKKGTIDLFPQA